MSLRHRTFLGKPPYRKRIDHEKRPAEVPPGICCIQIIS